MSKKEEGRVAKAEKKEMSSYTPNQLYFNLYSKGGQKERRRV